MRECRGPAGTLQSCGITKRTLFPFDCVSRQLRLTVLGNHVLPVCAFADIISNADFTPPCLLNSRIPVSPNFIGAYNLLDFLPYPCIIWAVINVFLHWTHICTEKPIYKEGLYYSVVGKLFFNIHANTYIIIKNFENICVPPKTRPEYHQPNKCTAHSWKMLADTQL